MSVVLNSRHDYRLFSCNFAHPVLQNVRIKHLSICRRLPFATAKTGGPVCVSSLVCGRTLTISSGILHFLNDLKFDDNYCKILSKSTLKDFYKIF